ncbi:MAG: hypothetical protein HDR80_08560 [Bacteroides sp.]|nr:hypothetical protein [Bacteroides sp.]
MLDTLITQLLIPAGSLIIGAVGGLLTKNGRIKAKAEAMKAMTEAYEMRLEAVHKVNETLNKNEVVLTARVAQLDSTIDDKTVQIRKERDRAYEAERETDRVNGLLVEKEREVAEWRVACEYLYEWHCRKPSCLDPEGRVPPNGKLPGKCFVMPAIMARGREEAVRLPAPACE